MNQERLLLIAEQVLGGKKLHEIDFGEPKLDLEEKLRRIDLAIRQYPMPDALSAAGQEAGSRSEHD
jgi:hypothetical protein